MKIKIEDIKRTAELYQWELLSTEYKNLDSPLEFLCPERHKVWIPYKKFRNKQKCPVCTQNLLVKTVDTGKILPKTEENRILALDQSSNLTGYSIYDGQTLVHYGVFKASGKTAYHRIVNLCDWVQSMIVFWKPDLLGIEDIQYNARAGGSNAEETNHNTFKLLGQVMGGIIITAFRNKCAVDTVLIPTWRKHCGVKGNKRADQKKSTQLLVKQWHDISVTDDESDAICIGKYYADRKIGEAKEGIGDYE